ncbi:MAG: prolyl oligopeptidase family serine peptidase [Deltaproteobacteria bacterium]|nr:prolyl oligopeptidase family serine peptidase [Deltaproteobacteria bacterium]
MLEESNLASGMKIWTARPDSNAKRPAVIILHGRRGPIEVDGSWDRVERLARDGFVGCVPDLYHRFTGDRGPIEAQQSRIDFGDAEYLADMDETIAYLKTLRHVDGDRIGIAGFCMSGRISLTYAAAREAKAVAMFHGGVYTRDFDGAFAGQEPIGNFIPKLSCPVLGLFGEQDHLVPPENVRRFRNEMEQHGKSYQIRIFRDTGHAWLNLKSHTYNRDSAEAAWAMFLNFLTEVFAGKWASDRLIGRFDSDTAV